MSNGRWFRGAVLAIAVSSVGPAAVAPVPGASTASTPAVCVQQRDAAGWALGVQRLHDPCAAPLRDLGRGWRQPAALPADRSSPAGGVSPRAGAALASRAPA